MVHFFFLQFKVSHWGNLCLCSCIPAVPQTIIILGTDFFQVASYCQKTVKQLASKCDGNQLSLSKEDKIKKILKRAPFLVLMELG